MIEFRWRDAVEAKAETAWEYYRDSEEFNIVRVSDQRLTVWGHSRKYVRWLVSVHGTTKEMRELTNELLIDIVHAHYAGR